MALDALREGPYFVSVVAQCRKLLGKRDYAGEKITHVSYAVKIYTSSFGSKRDRKNVNISNVKKHSKGFENIALVLLETTKNKIKAKLRTDFQHSKRLQWRKLRTEQTVNRLCNHCRQYTQTQIPVIMMQHSNCPTSVKVD